ncbi:hypothetical protein GGD67_002890 [Bradyrhizobium sp. IAR9]|uniref:hypothetical protein n=1 Tax=Bradyrhizobium sp. IAR9 TaxID=2663841 RepID=UPI0015CC393B|nr:hypothetical protein [Bradyrhizobium sp. IAR9]NYG45432.1 hypothetical protein [Bradyrhizobium sp. IAR9]
MTRITETAKVMSVVQSAFPKHEMRHNGLVVLTIIVALHTQVFFAGDLEVRQVK